MGKQILLEHLGKPDIQSIEGYLKQGGYSSVQKLSKVLHQNKLLKK